MVIQCRVFADHVWAWWMSLSFYIYCCKSDAIDEEHGASNIIRQEPIWWAHPRGPQGKEGRIPTLHAEIGRHIVIVFTVYLPTVRYGILSDWHSMQHCTESEVEARPQLSLFSRTYPYLLWSRDNGTPWNIQAMKLLQCCRMYILL